MNMIITHNGSVQNIPGIPDNVKAIYKTLREISQKKVIDLAADCGAFICQSRSMNIHLQAPTLEQLASMHFYGWKKGLKTGMYLRTRPAAQAIQFTVDQSVLNDAKMQQTNATNVRNAAEVVTVKGTGIPTPTSSTSSSLARSPCKAFNQWFSITSYQTGARDFVFAILSVPSHYIGRTGPYVAFFGRESPKGGRCGSGVRGCFAETEGEGAGGGQVDMFVGQQGGVSDVLWLSDCRSRRFRRTLPSIGCALNSCPVNFSTHLLASCFTV